MMIFLALGSGQNKTTKFFETNISTDICPKIYTHICTNGCLTTFLHASLNTSHENQDEYGFFYRGGQSQHETIQFSKTNIYRLIYFLKYLLIYVLIGASLHYYTLD